MFKIVVIFNIYQFITTIIIVTIIIMRIIIMITTTIWWYCNKLLLLTLLFIIVIIKIGMNIKAPSSNYYSTYVYINYKFKWSSWLQY